MQRKDERQQTQVVARKFSIRYKVYTDDVQKLEQLAQKGCKVSVLGDTQNFPDRALNNPLKLQSQPCFEQGVGPGDLQKSLSKQSYAVIWVLKAA